LKQIEETIKVAEKALFEAWRAHSRIDKLPTPEPPAAPVKGERGPAGTPGRDGNNGRDGVGLPGATGPQGRPGKDCQCRTELAEQKLASVEQKLADARGEFEKQIAELKFVVNALLDQNKKGAEYIAWLRERAAARSNKK